MSLTFAQKARILGRTIANNHTMQIFIVIPTVIVTIVAIPTMALAGMNKLDELNQILITRGILSDNLDSFDYTAIEIFSIIILIAIIHAAVGIRRDYKQSIKSRE